MTPQEIVSDIIKYGITLATISEETPETGLLSGHHMNRLLQDDVLWIADSSQEIVRNLVAQIKQVLKDEQPDDYECSMFFQYIFDKTVEVTFKVITQQEVNTKMNIGEIFQYYELDVPVHIQHNVSVKVPRISLINKKLREFVIEKGYQSEGLEVWLFGFLLTAVSIAISFTAEMDLNDIAALQELLKKKGVGE